MWQMYGLFSCMVPDKPMTEHSTEQYEYDEVSDLLDVYFGEKRPAWTIELTDHIWTVKELLKTVVPPPLNNT
jgi:hypothetical protein